MYDNLDKSLFEPVPLFLDSRMQLIRLDWPYLYKGTIRDFYPPLSHVPESPTGFQIYVESLSEHADWLQVAAEVGTPVSWSELPGLIDIAFLALHGAFGEDGQVQGLLESLRIPYTGSGILPSAIGINKAIQKRMMQEAGWPTPAFFTIHRSEWVPAAYGDWYRHAQEVIGTSVVVRPANQGSSIGVSIEHLPDEAVFVRMVDKAFFRYSLTREEWLQGDEIALVRRLTDIREGVGLPMLVLNNEVHHPDALLQLLTMHFSISSEPLLLEAMDGESEVVVEGFIDGKEFSCIVIRGEDEQGGICPPVALPPTEILKGKEVFDYRSKYLAGLSRKVTPINLPESDIQAIRAACERLFDFFGFHVYARIDGFIKEDGTIYLNDPNTTSGMLPSSFFFHQAAEIGLNPSQFLTYILRASLAEITHRSPAPGQYRLLLEQLDTDIRNKQLAEQQKTRIAVVLGGYSAERHISVESGRNIFEKLSSSTVYEPVPVFLSGSDGNWSLWQIPVNLLLKDNADDIREKIAHYAVHPVVEGIKEQCRHITARYAGSGYRFAPEPLDLAALSQRFGFIFIALHGRPGEDGELQKVLEQHGIPYNGSGPVSSALTINKYATNQLLKRHGIKVAGQLLVDEEAYHIDKEAVCARIEQEIGYPLIAKPVDDGCSAAVKKISDRQLLIAYLDTIFRQSEEMDAAAAGLLKLKLREEFPIKRQALIESLIDRGEAIHFLEITGGMLVQGGHDPQFEVFQPSEALATDAVLSLEEKFLAGEGQNLTPARLGCSLVPYEQVLEQVQETLRKTAELLGVRGYCRIDAFVKVMADGSVETWIIEVNSLPGMTPATVIFHQAALNGYKPFAFIDTIIQFGFDRQKAEFSDDDSARSGIIHS